MNGRLLTRRTVPALVAALSLGITGVAQASTEVSVQPDGTLKIAAGTEANGLSVYRISDTQVGTTTQQVAIVRDGDSNTLPPASSLPFPLPGGELISPGPGCSAEKDRPTDPDPTPGTSTHSIKCVTSGTDAAKPQLGVPTANGAFTAINATLGDTGDNIFRVFAGPTDSLGRSVIPFSVPATVAGGNAADVITGGPAHDTLTGAAGDDTLNGADGNDTLKPGAGGNNVSGGNGVDTVDFSDQTAGLAVSLDNKPNDGAGCDLSSTGGNSAACQNNPGNVRS